RPVLDDDVDAVGCADLPAEQPHQHVGTAAWRIRYDYSDAAAALRRCGPHREDECETDGDEKKLDGSHAAPPRLLWAHHTASFLQWLNGPTQSGCARVPPQIARLVPATSKLRTQHKALPAVQQSITFARRNGGSAVTLQSSNFEPPKSPSGQK